MCWSVIFVLVLCVVGSDTWFGFVCVGSDFGLGIVCGGAVVTG